MSCEECKYSPKTYEEYCISQSNPSMFCPDAYTERSYLCANYHAKKLAEYVVTQPTSRNEILTKRFGTPMVRIQDREEGEYKK